MVLVYVVALVKFALVLIQEGFRSVGLMSAFNRLAKLGVKAWGAMLRFWFLFHVFIFGSGCVFVFGSGYACV
jgi:hypothetical protein